MSRAPTLQEEVDALHDKYHKDAEERKRVEAERMAERLCLAGWSEKAINQRRFDEEDDKHPLCGVVDAYEESQDPWGAPDHMSDRKSKRKRTAQSPFVPWYQRGVLDDCRVYPPVGARSPEAGVLGGTERDDAKRGVEVDAEAAARPDHTRGIPDGA